MVRMILVVVVVAAATTSTTTIMAFAPPLSSLLPKRTTSTVLQSAGVAGPFRGLGNNYYGNTHRAREVLEDTTPPGGHWMDYLKFGGTKPRFNIVERTKKYTSEAGYKSFQLHKIPESYFDHERYVFRDSVVGPINRKDLVDSCTVMGEELNEAFGDLKRQTFGFCVDPENPYRCLFFERWTATHTGRLSYPSLPTVPATGKRHVSPVFPYSVTWTPKGKIIYESLTGGVDRFEGTSNGKVQVFGLLETAGHHTSTSVGDFKVVLLQKLQRLLAKEGKDPVSYSKKEDIPAWWKSRAVGAEWNDV